MRKIIALLALLAATTAHAGMSDGVSRAIAEGDISPQQVMRCMQMGSVANVVATQRDSGAVPPQVAYQMAQGVSNGAFSDGTLKNIVNTLYFDKDFQEFSPRVIEDSVTNVCLDPKRQYEPHYQRVQ